MAKVLIALLYAGSFWGTAKTVGVDLGIAGAALAAVLLFHARVIAPILRAANAVVDLVKLAESIQERLGLLEEVVSQFKAVIDLVRDESVQDVRTLIRRGSVPMPIIHDDPPTPGDSEHDRAA